eukprot:Colp12_sorted_trinity150504_noHs@4764
MKAVFVLLALALCQISSTEGAAHLLAAKSVVNEYVVESLNLTIEYHIFNVGNEKAVEVQLDDPTFNVDYFIPLEGNTSVTFDSIEAGANVSYTRVFKPVLPDVEKGHYASFNFTSGLVRYKASETAEDFTFTKTSTIGTVYVFPLNDYERAFGNHIQEWGIFAGSLAVLLGLPYLAWSSAKTKYSSKAKRA